MYQCVIGFGNWNNSEFMQNHAPTKGKGFRKLFRRAGYKVYLVDEYKTSKKCHNCESEDENSYCESFRKCVNPRPWKKYDISMIRHGLTRCTTCKCLWNRDVNSSLNIYKIIEIAINTNGITRPKYLVRGS